MYSLNKNHLHKLKILKWTKTISQNNNNEMNILYKIVLSLVK